MKRISMIAMLIQKMMIRMIESHVYVAGGAVFCFLADLSFWDCVATATLSFNSALASDFSSLFSAMCSP